jgi:uncharacterized protein YyaL (SSP411 family)
MSAIHAMGQRGGWPLSVFLFPDTRPFFGGTYFPPDDRGGRIGFLSLLERIATSWQNHRTQLEKTASQLAGHLQQESEGPVPVPGGELGIERARALGGVLEKALEGAFDRSFGGFGGAPKFPPHMALDWLTARSERDGRPLDPIVDATLTAMALGGIHDHLGGGFHRYSTDDRWLLPHFEKMLTDNGLLLGLYSRAFAATGKPLFARTALGIGEHFLSEMRGAEGGFFAGTDADSEGEEGRFFVWTAREIREVLGSEASFFERIYGVREDGNFHDEATGSRTGANILHLKRAPSEEEESRLRPLRDRLKARRAGRVAPHLDDKRIAAWNALAISGLAMASVRLAEPRFLDAARSAARFLLDRARDAQGRLLRSWKDGRGTVSGFLEDEAFLANALLDLADVTSGDEAREWLAHAQRSVEAVRRRFRGPSGRGFVTSGEGNERLLVAGRSLFDGAIPSASASACRALARAALATGDESLRREAQEALEEVSGLMERLPHGTESWYRVLDLLLGPSPEDEDGASHGRGPAQEPFDGEGCEGGVCPPQRPRMPGGPSS